MANKMVWHEIVKYCPQKYDSKGVYTAEEWTSRSDVGKFYEGKLFTIKDYLDVEQRYIAVVLYVMKAANCDFLTINYLEADKKYIVDRIKSSKFNEIDSPLLKSVPLLERKRKIYAKEVPDIIRLALREYAYVVLSNKERELLVEFGYDYYLKVMCSLNNETLRNIVQGEGLYLDPR